MAWFIYLAISAAFQVISGLLSKTPNAKPEQQFNAPVNDGSRPVPVVFGECLIKDPFLIDYFDFKFEKITIRNPATFFITTVTIGYHYFVGLVFGLSWADDMTILEVNVDNRPATTNINGLSNPIRVEINKPSFFGSEKKEGGVRLAIDVYKGPQTGANSYWQTQRGVTMPSYRDWSYAVV